MKTIPFILALILVIFTELVLLDWFGFNIKGWKRYVFAGIVMIACYELFNLLFKLIKKN